MVQYSIKYAVFPTGKGMNTSVYSATGNTVKGMFLLRTWVFEFFNLNTVRYHHLSFVSNNHSFFGASVHRKVNCSIRGTGVVEIECPYGRNEDK